MPRKHLVVGCISTFSWLLAGTRISKSHGKQWLSSGKEKGINPRLCQWSNQTVLQWILGVCVAFVIFIEKSWLLNWLLSFFDLLKKIENVKTTVLFANVANMADTQLRQFIHFVTWWYAQPPLPGMVTGPETTKEAWSKRRCWARNWRTASAKRRPIAFPGCCGECISGMVKLHPNYQCILPIIINPH